MDKDLLFQIALTKVPNIGDIHSKTLVQLLGSAEAVFNCSIRSLEKIEGIGKVRANCIKSFTAFTQIESEISFIERNNIQPIFFTSKNYPQKLLHCIDSPIMLYFKGNGNLNDEKIISIAGTRNHSTYGSLVCEKLIAELSSYSITIVSGLAYGIDTIAHKAALDNKLPTIAVLAHGLHTIYPSINYKLSREIEQQGGLLTEFCSKSKPDKQNFPRRNRITAGICDALIIVESGPKGGSLITANIANSYNKDVFAFPGRSIDNKSEGCNELIKSHKAQLITSGDDLVKMMGWQKNNISNKTAQLNLFSNLNDNEKKIVSILSAEQITDIDTLKFKSELSNHVIAGALLDLELSGKIVALPGKRFKLSSQ